MVIANYPRPVDSDDADRLVLLGEGYAGLNAVFLANFLLGYPANAIAYVGTYGAPTLVVATFVGLGLIVGPWSHRHLRKAGNALRWSSSCVLAISVALGATSVLCCGVFGFAVLQGILLRQLRREGVRFGFFGPSRDDVLAEVARRRTLARRAAFLSKTTARP